MPNPIPINKLVRDEMVRVIEDGGYIALTRLLSQKSHVTALESKLVEESGEYMGSRSVMELIDVMEVCIALGGIAHNYSEGEMIGMMHQKRQQKGGLKGGVFLLEVRPKDAGE